MPHGLRKMALLCQKLRLNTNMLLAMTTLAKVAVLTEFKTTYKTFTALDGITDFLLVVSMEFGLCMMIETTTKETQM